MPEKSVRLTFHLYWQTLLQKHKYSNMVDRGTKFYNSISQTSEYIWFYQIMKNKQLHWCKEKNENYKCEYFMPQELFFCCWLRRLRNLWLENCTVIQTLQTLKLVNEWQRDWENIEGALADQCQPLSGVVRCCWARPVICWKWPALWDNWSRQYHAPDAISGQ